MIVDLSAIVAIFFQEPETDLLLAEMGRLLNRSDVQIATAD